MQTSARGGLKAEAAVVIGLGLAALTALAVLAVMGVKWFSGELKGHASDPRVTLVGNSIGKAGTAETKSETAEAAPTYEKGTLTDNRDSKKYKTVTIGGKAWMAENLNYKPESGGSWCYDNSEGNCKKYGRLYDWNTALTACPLGWHLASTYDWDNMLLAISGKREAHVSNSDHFFAWDGVGVKLKAKRGWKELQDKSSGNGTDVFGFTALPAGAFLYSDDSFDRLGAYANWWTATEFDEKRAGWRYINYFKDLVVERFDNKGNGLSVRCVADSGGGDLPDSEKQKKKEEQKKKEAEQRKKETDENIAELSDYFTDSRDGRIYRTVTIDSARWMAENLNYKTTVGSWCYGDKDSGCVKYGRLYEWYAAMTSCPAGWHLPSREDWDNLGKAAGGEKRDIEETGTVDWIGVGIKLKAKRDWNGAIGTDIYGFSALPGGLRDKDDRYDDAGVYAYWWTSAEYRRTNAYIRFIFYSGNDFDTYLVENALFKHNGLSVRCVANK
jgi:uncharacterized protein (TIGR02145 family)